MRGVQEFLRFGLTAGGMLLLKLLLTHAFAELLPTLVAYLIVQVILTGVSYLAHARFTFRQDHSWSGLGRYAGIIVFFQGLDYVVFAGCFVFFKIDTTVSILLATLIIFVVRYIIVRRSFRRSAPADFAGSSDA